MQDDEEFEVTYECIGCGDEITESMYEHIDHEINPDNPLCYKCSVAQQTCEFCDKQATRVYGENYVCDDHGPDPD
ncbi:hypothetical protein [Nitrosomonas sp. Nm58]|uniref:hypothetical protein n=1 Tax=Nitrosomonas sp. Nm58 TaxID=200126 RepID=UPI00089859E3|nr:hypothetical protein [Nitrosomonas sp. Nm58]SDY15273.1 hypothetical protein SAMN05421754_1002122 [Nitrosomonas sp. Nm58]